MEKQELEKLIEGKPPEVSKKAILLFNGHVMCATAYRKEPSAANLKSWQAAEAALEEFVSSLDVQKKDRLSFKNKKAAAKYLKDQGVRIGKSKLYKDAESGKLRVQPDGSVLLSDVDLYVKAYLTPKQRAGDNYDIEQLQKEKLELESEKLKEQIAKLAWDREKEAGRYLLRSDFEMELAARAAVLETSLRQMAQTKAYDWIAVCRGEHSKAADMAAMVTAEIGAVLNDYAATDKFQVIFIEEEDSRGPATQIGGPSAGFEGSGENNNA